MTTFVAWVGVDSRGAASVNFASDSRITWSGPKGTHWDLARKTFSSSKSADIFGYVNDVMFPSMMLGQLINAIDSGGLFSDNLSSYERFEILVEHIKYSHSCYPLCMRESFCIFHGSREGEGMSSAFSLNTIAWDKSNSLWNISQVGIPTASSAIIIDGSGSSVARKWSKRWNASNQGGTSRAVFSSFCNAVYSGEDKLTYGAPQLVSLYRKGSGKTIGFVHGKRKYISGLEVLSLEGVSEGNEVEWRNKYFERCEMSGDRIDGAQEHYVPKGLR